MSDHSPAVTTRIDEQLARDLLAHIRTYADFPRQGVNFQDLCPVFAQPRLLTRLAAAVADRFTDKFDLIMAAEARGFVFGTAVAQVSDCPLVLARKPGKLPGPVHSVRYTLEYGETSLEMQHCAFPPGARALLVDDVLATGGTLSAAKQLVQLASGHIAGYAVVVTIAGLGGAARLAPFEPFSAVTVPV